MTTHTGLISPLSLITDWAFCFSENVVQCNCKVQRRIREYGRGNGIKGY